MKKNMKSVIKNKKPTSFGNIIAILGSVLIGIGILWLIAQNWHYLHQSIKISILLTFTALAYFLGAIFKDKDYKKLGSILIFLGSIVWTASVFLIAQTFNLPPSLQGTATLFLFATIGTIFMSYLLESSSSLVLGIIEFIIWLNMQYFAFQELNRDQPSPFGLIILFLCSAIIFFFLFILHKEKKHFFAKIFKYWTIIYILIFSFTMSFQLYVSALANLPITINNLNYSNIFIATYIIITIFIVVFSFSYLKLLTKINKKEEKNEIIGFGILVGIMILFIAFSLFVNLGDYSKIGICEEKRCYEFKDSEECATSSICIWEVPEPLPAELENQQDIQKEIIKEKYEGYCIENYKKGFDEQQDYYLSIKKECSNFINKKNECLKNEKCIWRDYRTYYISWFKMGKYTPLRVWALWILSNIMFIAIILLIIWYGTLSRDRFLINLGIVFFVLEVISRYIGFIIDLWGYTSLAFVFISGGIILIAGSWAIEKARRKLIEKIK